MFDPSSLIFHAMARAAWSTGRDGGAGVCRSGVLPPGWW